MQRHELEHIIRAAAHVTNRYEFIVVGSQSILGAVPNPPTECVMSMEADIFPLGAEELSDRIEGAIGEGSQFHDTFGYYAQGVGSNTAILPAGWETRLVRIQSEATHGFVGYCLDPTDLFLAKCAANRDKDRGFNRALLRSGHVQANDALARVVAMPLDVERKKRMAAMIRRLDKEAKEAR
jgi:hypothetical protein